MAPYNHEPKPMLSHQVSSVLTSDASSDEGHHSVVGGNRSIDGYDLHDLRGFKVGDFDQQLFFVTSYSDFDKLAHGPRGHIAKHTLRVYRFHTDGSLVLLHVSGEGTKVVNPAFSRFHPR